MKFLVVLSLFASMLLAGCGGSSNTNANANANANKPPSNALASTNNDGDLKKKIEDGLKAKGCTAVTVEVKDGTATARGTYPKGKLPDCMMAINDAKPGKVENQMTEGK